MDVQTSNDMDTLIDLNAGIEEERTWSDAPSMRSEASVLRMGETTPEMRRRASWQGFGIGILVGLIPSSLIFIFSMDSFPENSLMAALSLGAFGAAGILISNLLLKQDAQNGYMKVDWEALEYWTRGGIVTISMGDIFGAGPEKGFLKEILRVCVVADNKRGFEFKKPGFDGYVAESGAARKIGGSIETGNALVRKTIIYHMQDRRKKGLRVSELPEYRFKSVQAHREFLIAGDVVEDAKFDCDGKTLVYEKKSERWEIPVRSVRKTSVHEARSQYGRTAYRVTLELDPSSGYEELKMDILRMSNAEEIDRYCRCLPTVFPRKELDGYWS